MEQIRLMKKRERKYLITIYKLVKQMGRVGNEDFVLKREGKNKERRGHNTEVRKGKCLNILKKFRFLKKSVDAYDEVNEEVEAASCVRQMKVNFDKHMCGNRTTRV